MQAFHENTYYAALRRCMAGDYRELSGGTYFGPVFLFCLGCLVLVVPGRFHLVRG